VNRSAATVGRWVLAAVVTALVGACTTEQVSTPGPTLTSTTSTTSTTTTSTTTIPPTTMPSTTESTTTTPSGPVAALVPLFVGGADSTGWLFLGAWQQDRWQASSDPNGAPFRPGVEAGASVIVSDLGGQTPAVLGDNAEACFDGRVGPTIDVDVPAPDPPGFGYGAVAVLTPTWALDPRPAATTASAPAAYQALGEAAFEGEPVDATQGSIEQLVVTDLDGDGDDEALAAFEHVGAGGGPGTPGDLAAVLLIDVNTRTASTVLQSVVDEDLRPTEFPLIERYRILDVADLNGDGRMEVLVHAWYYEGAAVIVYTYDGTGLTEVLSAGCGA
jgi:hypothetical protein